VNRVVVIGGPTASGKSALALGVAEARDGVVINADSMQVYRELRTLTARPRAEDEARAPHRLYGVLSAREVCSAARWTAMVREEIAAVHAAGRLPVVVGGTGLYLKTLMEGIAPVPAIPAEVRAATRARHAAEGSAALHAELLRRDPDSAARLHPSDAQRIVRALEVVEATGVPLSTWQREPAATHDLAFSVFVLLPPREPLYAAIDARLRRMVEGDALDEVRRLLALDLDPGAPALKALGVAEFARHLDGASSLEDAVAAAQQATRNFAKRQLTWFRNQLPADMPGVAVISEQYSDDVMIEVIRKLA